MPAKGQTWSDDKKLHLSEVQQKRWKDGRYKGVDFGKGWHKHGLSPILGKKQTTESNAKRSATESARYKTQVHPSTGRKQSEEEKRRRIETQYPNKTSKIERKLVWALAELVDESVIVGKHVLKNRPDVYFPQRRLVVFVDGDHWHVCPEHDPVPWTYDIRVSKDQPEVDKAVTLRYLAEGFKVVRIWTCELEKDFEKCVQKIIYEGGE